MKTLPLLLVAAIALSANAQEKKMPDQAQLEKMAARFAPTEITVDLSKLSPNDRKVLASWSRLRKLSTGSSFAKCGRAIPRCCSISPMTPRPRAAPGLHYFIINKGPWSALDENEPFVVGAPPKPPGAGFYPLDASKEMIEATIKAFPPQVQEQAKGFFTVLRRKPYNNFAVVPYSTEYEGELTIAAKLLREAAAAATEPTLQKFLKTRADAFLTNNYYPSDVAWMELKGAIEPTIGPYEVYNDEWFNYKAGFEAFITVLDEGESAKLQKFSSQLQDIENHLPIDPKYRNPKLGALSAHRGRERALRCGRRQSWRADRRLQPA